MRLVAILAVIAASGVALAYAARADRDLPRP